MADVEGGLSKSAKKRANLKARLAVEAEAAVAAAAPPPPPPAPEPKGKAKAKAKPEAKAPAAEPKAKAKAAAEPPAANPKAKAKSKAEPKAPAAEPKAKAKGKAEPPKAPAAEPPKAPAAEPKAAAAKPKAKGKAAKAKAKPADEEEEQPKKKQVEEMINYVIDDGTGGDWELSSGLSTKQAKRKEKQDADTKYLSELKAAAGGVLPKNTVPGMAPIDPKASAKDRAAANQSASADVARILAQTNDAEIAAAANVAVATVTVPEKRIGIVIGPGGANIKMIQEKTGVTRIDTAGGIFTISGKGPAVKEAEAAVNQLVEKGFCSILYDDFAENYVNVHPSYFPDIIGKGGVIIQKIKKELKVEVSIPPMQPDAAATKKYKVTLAGSSKQVEEAKDVINSIIMYSHHEITHPGLTHEEIEVDKWCYSFIIGKGGSELKHIQKNWDVKMSIPREHSINQKVLIVGEPSNVERAKTYVEKVLWNAENQVRGGRDKDTSGDGDGWGDEEPEEAWMKDYLYKR